MRRPGTLKAGFDVARAAEYEMWLQGQFMPSVGVAVDGRKLTSIKGQLAGNSLVPDTATPVAVRLTAGRHRLAVTRAGFSLAPGNGGSAVLDGAFLAPAGTPARQLRTLSPGENACSARFAWVELVGE